MESNRKRLAQHQIDTIVKNVVKKIFKNMKKTISDQIDIALSVNQNEIHSTDFINIVLLSMISLDANMISSLNKPLKNIDMDKVISIYVENLFENLNKLKQKIDNEKMN